MQVRGVDGAHIAVLAVIRLVSLLTGTLVAAAGAVLKDRRDIKSTVGGTFKQAFMEAVQLKTGRGKRKGRNLLSDYLQARRGTV